MKKHSSFLTFFGTGTSQGVPPIGCTHPVCLSNNPKDKRLRSSVYLEIDKQHLLIDCGPDFRQQMLLNKKSKLDAIFFTHEHNDHVIGLDDVRPIFFQNENEVSIYGLKRVLDEIEKRFPYVFKNTNYPGIPKFSRNNIVEGKIQNFNPYFEALNIIHGNLPILGYKIKDLVYITDASFISEQTIDKILGCEILILNALRKEPKHFAHFILDESLEMIQKIKPKRAYLTHISHNLGFHDEVEASLPKDVFLAYDGLELSF